MIDVLELATRRLPAGLIAEAVAGDELALNTVRAEVARIERYAAMGPAERAATADRLRAAARAADGDDGDLFWADVALLASLPAA